MTGTRHLDTYRQFKTSGEGHSPSQTLLSVGRGHMSPHSMGAYTVSPCLAFLYFFSRQTTLGIVSFEGRVSYPICPPLRDANEVWEHSGPTREQFINSASCMVCVVRPCARYFNKRKISRLFWVRTVSSFQFFFIYAGHQQMCFMLVLTMYTAVRKFKCLK